MISWYAVEEGGRLAQELQHQAGVAEIERTIRGRDEMVHLRLRGGVSSPHLPAFVLIFASEKRKALLNTHQR